MPNNPALDTARFLQSGEIDTRLSLDQRAAISGLGNAVSLTKKALDNAPLDAQKLQQAAVNFLLLHEDRNWTPELRSLPDAYRDAIAVVAAQTHIAYSSDPLLCAMKAVRYEQDKGHMPRNAADLLQNCTSSPLPGMGTGPTPRTATTVVGR